MALEYGKIEAQLSEALPELLPAAEQYWSVEGRQGQDCGAYIFFESMFATYVEVLLVMNSSPLRNHLLARAFGFVEQMLASADLDVVNLAYVGLLEWRPRWWYAQAGPYIGPHARAELDRYFPEWRTGLRSGQRPTEQAKAGIIDLYGVRPVIASALAPEGIDPKAIPGATHLS